MLFYLYKNRTIIHFLAFTIALLATVGLSRLSVRAQEPLQWSPQQQIPDYDPETLSPYLAADQNKTVHAVSSQWIDESRTENVIMYNQWTLENGWTTPNDILLPPYRNQVFVEGLFLDKAGILHLMFFGGDDRDANIYYTTTPASEAAKAPAWESPKIVGWNAKTPRTAALAGDNNGNLVIVYHSNMEGNGLYVIYSNDNGETWSEPEPIFLTYSNDLWPWSLKMDWGASGRLHAVWNVVQPSGRNETGYYAHLDNIDTRQWSEPIELAQNTGLGIAIPAVIERDGEVFMIFNNGIGDEESPVQWMRRSMDGGQTWTEPIVPFPSHIGRNGAVSFTIDSDNKLHAFFGQRTHQGNTDIHGMWHSVWQNGSWTPLKAVVSGPPTESFDPVDAHAVTVQGNTILVTWTTDPGRGDRGVWYSYTTLDTPELSVQASPTPLLTATPVPTITPMPIATKESLLQTRTSKPLPTDNIPASSTDINNNPGSPVFFSAISTILLIFAILVIQRLMHRH